MHMQVAGLRVADVDHHLARTGGHQGAAHRHAGVVIGGDDHVRAGLQAARVAIGLQMRHGGRRGRARHLEGLRGAHLAEAAVAERGNALVPGQQRAQVQQRIDLGRAVLAQQEDRLPAGQVCRAGLRAKKKGPSGLARGVAALKN